MRTTWVPSLALLLALVPCAQTRAEPLDRPAALVVSGVAPASATLRVTTATTLDLGAATITAAGQLGGVAIFARGAFQAAAVTVPALDRQPSTRPVATDPTAVPGPTRRTLSPGLYVVHLLGDGTVEVRIPFDRSQDQTLRANARSVQTVAVRTGALGAMQPTAAVKAPFTAGARTWLVALGLYRPLAVSQNVRLTTCVARAGRACGKADPRLSVTVDTDAGLVRAYFPAEPGAGKREVVVSVTAEPGTGGDVGLAAVTVQV